MTAPDHTHTDIHDLISLAGRVAVVTGAAHGIGRAIARRFLQAGATVLLTDMAADELSTTSAELGRQGLKNEWRLLDVTSSPQISELAASIAAEYGTIDIWVNNAGIYPVRPFLEMTDDDWDRVIEVNLNGAFRCSREAARHMVAAGSGGVILNIASVSGYRGRPGLAHYSASKHGLRGLTRTLAVELGIHGIRALGIAPTMVTTPGTEAVRATATPATSSSLSVYDHLPAGRSAVPDDVARVALFCVSDLATMMTGSTLAVDGGQMSM